MSTFYLKKNIELNNPNITDHVYVTLNINRNVPREMNKTGTWKASPDNKSIDLLAWLDYVVKRGTTTVTAGSYSGPAAAFTGGATEGALYYNTTNKQVEVLMGQGAYADDATAATGGVNVGELYYNTTSNSYTTRMA